MFELTGKKVLVIGLARTGLATSLFCAKHGALVTATDTRSESDLAEASAKLRAAGIAQQLGGYTEKILDGQELVIPSPGVPANSEILKTARGRNIPVWSEIELADRFLHGRLIGITGSNGKTTTTPLIDVVEQTNDQTVTVAELSSFQLEWIETFRPNISVFLNLTPDHLDRHGSMEAYGAAKARIFEKQTTSDFAVLNADDPASTPYAPSLPKVFWFSRKQRVAQGTFLSGEEILFRHHGEEEMILKQSEIPLPGAHNLENVLAAVTAAGLIGARPHEIQKAVRSFKGVEHRLEFVAELNGVRYYNDSKATNVDATLKALNAFPGRILIILGGKDKGSDYTALQASLREKAILALLIGAAAPKIESQIAGSVAIEQAGTLERAVETAAHAARAGDVVLLAPACASFDQFENYEHRGRVFKQLVHDLQNHAATTTSGGR